MPRLLIKECFFIHQNCLICHRDLNSEKQGAVIETIDIEEIENYQNHEYWQVSSDKQLAYSAIGPVCLNNEKMAPTNNTLELSFTECRKFSENSPTSLIRYIILREFLLPITDDRFNTKFEITSIALNEIISTGSLVKNAEKIRRLATNSKLYPRFNPNNLAKSYLTYHAMLDLKSLYHSKRKWIPGFIESMTKHLCSRGYLTKDQIKTLNGHYDDLSGQPCYKFKNFIIYDK